MKRHIRSREKKIKENLNKIIKNQEGQRNKRRKQGFRTVAIVGYTNAGKSQLLNSLSKKEIKIKNELFATLDSRIGKIWLEDLKENVLISDTIGFIRDLPPELIEAFHSTLAETIHADLLLHVIDSSDLEMEWKIKIVDEVLKKLNCEKKPCIYLMNKIDLIDKRKIEKIQKKFKNLNPIFISAKEKRNLNTIKENIVKNLS